MKRCRRVVYFSCALVLLLTGSAAFGNADAEFTNANQQYASRHFKEAIASYEALVLKKEWSANLFYDLGNAYFRDNNLGKAILNYERALLLDPHHPEAEANLRFARDQARALQMQPGAFDRYAAFASVNTYTATAAVTFWIALFSIVVAVLARRRSTAAIMLSILSSLIFVMTAGAVYLRENGKLGRGLAIVTSPDVNARVATADTANAVLAVPPGSEIKVLSTRGDWIYAELPNSSRGWMPANSAELVRL
jgi:tetratricopeptide (TPR) repeat protein